MEARFCRSRILITATIGRGEPLVRAGPPGPALYLRTSALAKPTWASAADQGVRPTLRAPRLTSEAGFCSNRQMPEPEVRAVSDNLLQALRFFGHARASSEIQDLPGVSLIFCGLNYAAFNAALIARPVEGDGEELSRIIQVSARRFDARNLRWTCWVCDDFLSRAALGDADRIFSRYGLRPLTQAPGMYTRRTCCSRIASCRGWKCDRWPTEKRARRLPRSWRWHSRFRPRSARQFTGPSSHGRENYEAMWDS